MSTPLGKGGLCWEQRAGVPGLTALYSALPQPCRAQPGDLSLTTKEPTASTWRWFLFSGWLGG